MCSTNTVKFESLYWLEIQARSEVCGFPCYSLNLHFISSAESGIGKENSNTPPVGRNNSRPVILGHNSLKSTGVDM